MVSMTQIVDQLCGEKNSYKMLELDLPGPLNCSAKTGAASDFARAGDDLSQLWTRLAHFKSLAYCQN